MRAARSGKTPTRERLIRTAARLFRQRGFAATSTRELSDALGIQNASLYHHIRGKEDLLYRISIDSLAAIYEAVQSARDSVPREDRLRAMISAHVHTALTDRDLHATMLMELRALSDSRRELVLRARDDYQAMLTSAIIDAQGAGSLRTDIDSKHLTLALLNLLNWTIFWYDPEGSDTPQQISELLTTMYFDGAANGEPLNPPA